MKRVDAGEFQSRFFQISPFERDNAVEETLLYLEIPLGVHRNDYRGDFQYSVGLGIKAASLYVHDNRHVGAKSLGQGILRRVV